MLTESEYLSAGAPLYGGALQMISLAMSNPFLSICIPTFNRSPYLCKTLDAIVSEPLFQKTDEIEIIVSDNASTDDTPLLMSRFCSTYPGKIRYLRLTEPIDSHFNFQNALDHGRGEYLKLLNDTVMFRPGMLKQLCDEIRKHPDGDVFLTNRIPGCSLPEKRITAVCDAVSICSFYITWIASYTYRKRLYRSFPDPFRYFALYFPQEDIYFRALVNGSVSYLLNKEFFEMQRVAYKIAQRNEAEIFGDCYLRFLLIYVNSGTIPCSVFKKEKYDVLMLHTIPVYFDFSKIYFGGKTLGWLTFWRSCPLYHKEFYFWFAFIVSWFYKQARMLPGINFLAQKCKDLFEHLIKCKTRTLEQP